MRRSPMIYYGRGSSIKPISSVCRWRMTTCIFCGRRTACTSTFAISCGWTSPDIRWTCIFIPAPAAGNPSGRHLAEAHERIDGSVKNSDQESEARSKGAPGGDLPARPILSRTPWPSPRHRSRLSGNCGRRRVHLLLRQVRPNFR